MHPKEFYSNYLADNELCNLNFNLILEVLKENPNHVLEFGMGTGKNLRLILDRQYLVARSNISVSGIDISLQGVLHSQIKNGIEHVSIGNENHLRHYCNYDVVITCSVLDHIEEIDGIIEEFKRIANKAVILAECTEADVQRYYYAHDFEKYGFVKLEGTKYFSESDGHTYHIYKWTK